MASEDIEAKNIIDKWKKNKMFLNVDQYRYAQDVAPPKGLKVHLWKILIFSYTVSCTFQLEAALVRDVVTVISSALKDKRLYERIDEPPTRCSAIDREDQFWDSGIEFLQNIDVGKTIDI